MKKRAQEIKLNGRLLIRKMTFNTMSQLRFSNNIFCYLQNTLVSVIKLI
jgi:hypothetical protein